MQSRCQGRRLLNLMVLIGWDDVSLKKYNFKYNKYRCIFLIVPLIAYLHIEIRKLQYEFTYIY